MGVASFELRVSGETLYRELSADGVVISTQTGSTAYSGAAGGQIFLPSKDSSTRDVVVTPITATAHAIRPLSVNINEEGGSIDLQLLPGASEAVLLQADSTPFGGVEPGEGIRVSKHKTPILFASFGFGAFVQALQEKHKIPNL